MNNTINPHTFHIPVMGIAFSLDTPIKVAPYGISSVLPVSDDMLIEKLREYYSNKFNINYQPIPSSTKDHRADRITSYLNLIDEIVTKKFEDLKNSIHEKGSELAKYIEMLPDFSTIKKEFNEKIKSNNPINEIKDWVCNNLSTGSIDVNIMTKLDKENFYKGEKLPVEYNDAHAALRGFANSKLNSAVVLSAGMNPRLYSYFENFEDFYPDAEGNFKKRIILKVSDYRSALIQGKILAKKGIWISEYRIESGLNCGGHAFATDGNLMGPILEEFKTNRYTLIASIYEIYEGALKNKNRTCPATAPHVKITAQGGVGTAEEHQFLMDHYDLDSIGWGSPFLLVHDATTVDDGTLKQLCDAKEDDLYLSNISPLGVRFNNLRGNTRDVEKEKFIKEGTPGSLCTKNYLALYIVNDMPLCTASRKYQSIKIDELNAMDLTPEEHKKQFDKIVEKSCLCKGLEAAALLKYGMDTKATGTGVSICPGPNTAYFSDIVSLKEMIDHIYGRINIIKRTDRPNMFINELKMYIDYLLEKLQELTTPFSKKDLKHVENFLSNLKDGVNYYKNLFANSMTSAINDLHLLEKELNKIVIA